MNLGPVTKFDIRNKTTSKKFDDDIIPENCDVKIVIVISGFWPIWSSLEAGFRTESVKVIFSVIVTFHLKKNCKLN